MIIMRMLVMITTVVLFLFFIIGNVLVLLSTAGSISALFPPPTRLRVEPVQMDSCVPGLDRPATDLSLRWLPIKH